MKYKVTLEIELNVPDEANRLYINDALDDEMMFINDRNATWSHLISEIEKVEK